MQPIDQLESDLTWMLDLWWSGEDCSAFFLGEQGGQWLNSGLSRRRYVRASKVRRLSIAWFLVFDGVAKPAYILPVMAAHAESWPQ